VGLSFPPRKKQLLRHPKTCTKEHQGSQEGIHLPTMEELEEAIDKLKNSEAPRSDNINVKLIKSSKPVLINILHKIIQKVRETEKLCLRNGRKD
jgi:hypothetical protein